MAKRKTVRDEIDESTTAAPMTPTTVERTGLTTISTLHGGKA